MKRLFLLLLVATSTLAFSCQASGEESNDKKTEKDTKAAKGDKSDKATIELTKEEFKQKVMDYKKHDSWQFAGDKPCLIDFYADWCGPCRITGPILEDIAKEYKGKINVYKVDVDDEKELASVFGIRGIPAFLYCPMEGKPQMASGIGNSKEQTRKMFVDRIEKILLKNK